MARSSACGVWKAALDRFLCGSTAFRGPPIWSLEGASQLSSGRPLICSPLMVLRGSRLKTHLPRSLSLSAGDGRGSDSRGSERVGRLGRCEQRQQKAMAVSWFRSGRIRLKP